LHIFKADTSNIVLPALSRKIVRYQLMNGGDVKVLQTNDSIVVKIGKYDFQSPETIVELELDGSAIDISPLGDVPINRLGVAKAITSSNSDPYTASLASDMNMLTSWKSDGKLGWLEYDLGKEKTVSRAVFFEGKDEGQLANIRSYQIQALVAGLWKTVKEVHSFGDGDNPSFDSWPISVFYPEIRFAPVTTRYVRLVIVRSTANPVIHEFELYEK
jgi:hypothetical protein